MFWDICLLNHKTDYAASEELFPMAKLSETFYMESY